MIARTRRSRSPCKPIAVFATAEINKYQRYANFGIDVEVVTGNETPDYFRQSSGKRENFKSAHPNSSANSPIAKYQPPSKGGYGVKTNIFRGLSPKSKLLLAAGAGIGTGIAAGVGGATFLRRRRTKKGKIVVENVRRKA